MGFFSCICSVLFSTDLQPLADVFNAVISIFILAALSWASLVFLVYLLFGVTLSRYSKFEGNQNHQDNMSHQDHQNQNTRNTQKNEKGHFVHDVTCNDDSSKHVADLHTAVPGEQLFINGYLQGYRDGKKGKRPVYTQSDSWKEAGEEALEHIRQSFVHDEEELRRAMSGGR